jgi:hypothetical protein
MRRKCRQPGKQVISVFNKILGLGSKLEFNSLLINFMIRHIKIYQAELFNYPSKPKTFIRYCNDTEVLSNRNNKPRLYFCSLHFIF